MGILNDDDFECRSCGHNEYKPVYGNRRPDNKGRDYFLEYFVCPNCSVIFLDPRKFSKKGKKDTEKDIA